MRTAFVIVGALFGILLLPVSAAVAGCGASASLRDASSECFDGREVRDLYATASADGYTYSLDSRCKPGEQCTRDERICRTETGASGTWYVLSRTTDATGASTNLGIVCLAPADVAGLNTITPAMVRREMQRLDWPQARLEVQPPDGQTLINFDTNFFTENDRATTQTVTLLGQRVEIEARPSEYTWEFGDGARLTTSSPGAAYPDLDVTHDYADPGRVGPSVDTTYTGRYRINGDAWQQIPGSLTVPGESVALRVRSASPHLIGTY
ncbi:MAG: hypothetical protein WKF50_06270 [Nocardioides sp.]